MYSSNKITETNHIIEASQLRQDNNFLFISNNITEVIEYQTYFTNSYIVNDFSEAKINIQLHKSPELIIIDIPLNHLQLVEFKVWLRLNHFINIPIIYNEGALKQEYLKQLFLQGLVDDVVNLQSNYKKLPYKVKFIQKIYRERPDKTTNINYHSPFANTRGIIMRFIDILISTITIFFLLPIFILIAISIKIESKGPIFYSSLRAGKGFSIFKFYKFRTMITDADKITDELANMNIYSSGSQKPYFFKIKNDPRITKVGTFLRNTSLDELPQLLNVIKGDMSIVGNRPLPLYEATTLTTNEWAERFMAPAGITGLWQISKRGNAEMSNEERILLDISYARNRSLKGDLQILIKTPSALIQKANV